MIQVVEHQAVDDVFNSSRIPPNFTTRATNQPGRGSRYAGTRKVLTPSMPKFIDTNRISTTTNCWIAERDPLTYSNLRQRDVRKSTHEFYADSAAAQHPAAAPSVLGAALSAFADPLPPGPALLAGIYFASPRHPRSTPDGAGGGGALQGGVQPYTLMFPATRTCVRRRPARRCEAIVLRVGRRLCERENCSIMSA